MISACVPYHEEIRVYVKQGWSIAAIHRGLERLGYPHTVEAVRRYVKRTMGDRCKRGHPFDKANTGWVHSVDHGRYRYCKVCKALRKARAKARASRRGGG